MSIFCKLFGHKPQEGVSSGAEYMGWGNWGAVDGVGCEHRSLIAWCARCHQDYVAGKVHMPVDYDLAKARRDQAIRHLDKLLNERRTAMQAWESERAAREWLDDIGAS